MLLHSVLWEEGFIYERYVLSGAYFLSLLVLCCDHSRKGPEDMLLSKLLEMQEGRTQSEREILNSTMT